MVFWVMEGWGQKYSRNTRTLMGTLQQQEKRLSGVFFLIINITGKKVQQGMQLL
jgi:hypothetical protein